VRRRAVALIGAGVSVRHHIASIAPLERWCREYRAGGGAEALRPRAKGRPRGSSNGPAPAATREQELAEQLAFLEAKVAYLEKLHALQVSRSRGATRPRSRNGLQGKGTGWRICWPCRGLPGRRTTGCSRVRRT